MTEQLLLVILHFFFCEAQDRQSCLKKVVFSFFYFFLSFSLFGPCSFASDCKVWSFSICRWEPHYLYYRSTCFQEPKVFPVWSILFVSTFLSSLFIHCFCSKSAPWACWSLGCYRKQHHFVDTAINYTASFFFFAIKVQLAISANQ